MRNPPRFLNLKNFNLMIPNIQHPRKECVPLAVGLAWRDDGAIYQEKMDGRFMTRTILGGAVLAGEQMRSGEFVCWDCVAFGYQDIRSTPFFERLKIAQGICQDVGLRMATVSHDGAALLGMVLAGGGEGVVRKLPGAAYFDTMQACKRLESWRCMVTALNYATGGADIVDAATGEARGTVPLRDRVTACRVGSLVKVEGLGLHASGKVREPRVCRDSATSWLIQF